MPGSMVATAAMIIAFVAAAIYVIYKAYSQKYKE